MDRIETVCLLGFGEVGATLAEDLLQKTAVSIIIWDTLLPLENSRPHQRLAQIKPSARLRKASSARAAAMQADLCISAVTASQALTAAITVSRHLKHQAWYVDLNSVAPTTKQEIYAVVNADGGRFVEAAVMAPIGPRRIETPMLLAGPGARDYLVVARQLGFIGTSFFSDILGQAAASKICRSVVVKGMEALITEALLAARFYGVENEVLRSLNNLLPHPDWHAHAQYMISRTLEHGQRRADEMREASKTVRAAGVAPSMTDACVQRQEWAATLTTAAYRPELADMLDAIRQRCPVNE